MRFLLKTCQTVAGISMIAQFPDFLGDRIFDGVLTQKPFLSFIEIQDANEAIKDSIY